MKEYIERMKAVSVIKSYEFDHCPEYMQDWATKLKRAILDDITADMMETPAAKVIEAPCDIGEVFWKVDDVNKRVERVKVSGLTKKANGTWKIRITCHYGVYEIVPNEIGKHVFRTEEEAEVALNEGVH